MGFGRDPGGCSAALELGAIDRAADSIADAVDGADLCFACAPVGALPELVRAALDAAGPDCVVSDVGSTKQGLLARDRRRALRRRPPDRRRRDGGRGARPGRHVPGRRLVPDPAAALRRPALRAAAPLRGGRRRAAGGGRPRHPRPARRRVQPPAARARQRARLPGRRAAGRPRRGAAPRGPELPRHDPRGGRQHRHLDRHLPRQPRRDRRGDRRVPARARARGGAARRGRPGRPGTTAPATTGARCSSPTRPAGRCASCASPVPNRPGIVAQVALELGKAG